MHCALAMSPVKLLRQLVTRSVRPLIQISLEPLKMGCVELARGSGRATWLK